MKQKKISRLSSLALCSFITLLFMIGCKKDNNSNNPPQSNTITNVVSTETNFTTLKSAVVKAGLATTLSGAGPYTVFAPDNDAFATAGISSSTIAALPDSTVKKILLYHTIASKIPAASVPAGPNASVQTAEGDSVFVTSNSSGVFVNGIKVKQADVAASNGVIHVLSSVLIPPPGNIVQLAQSDTVFSYLVAAVLRASQGSTNVAAVLSGNGPYTVFAPTNNAFRAAGYATVNDINAASPDALASILTYHAIADAYFLLI